MEITHTEWHPEEIGGTPELAATADKDTAQPEIGLVIGWNEPSKIWKPYLVLNLWTVRVQIGWLY